uniref:Uncharacterized protein n=1 Tax=Utricularia reniformis TaxID=192314 RepID=A0A1Y0B4C2_9LAMI|nr:hypothetical protein AEK19_MT2083 [Utricularia reniformis]ART32238.1 hypothetical protein AEK19_MT2083 [Utricularia reniformis]
MLVGLTIIRFSIDEMRDDSHRQQENSYFSYSLYRALLSQFPGD